MKKIEVTDELLYKYMPIADEMDLDALEEELADEAFILSPKTEKKIKRLIWNEKHKWVVEFGKFMAKVAVVCFGILTIGLAVTMSVDAYRSKFFQTVQELLGDSALHTYDTNEDEQGFVPHEPTYIPEGYVEVSRFESEKVLSIEYMDNKGGYFCWDQSIAKEGTWSALDIEYEEQEIIKLTEGILIINYYEEDFIYAYYESEKYVYIATIMNMETEEIVKIFDSIE